MIIGNSGRNDYWNAQLTELQNNVDNFKRRLSQILQRELEPGLLEGVEQFQNLLLNKDVVIGLMRHDIVTNRQFGNLVSTSEQVNEFASKLQQDICKLKHDITAMHAQLLTIEQAAKHS
jgi:hypothetical protein